MIPLFGFCFLFFLPVLFFVFWVGASVPNCPNHPLQNLCGTTASDNDSVFQIRGDGWRHTFLTSGHNRGVVYSIEKGNYSDCPYVANSVGDDPYVANSVRNSPSTISRFPHRRGTGRFRFRHSYEQSTRRSFVR